MQSYSYTSQVKTYCSRTLTHCDLNKILQLYYYTLRVKKYSWCNITHCELNKYCWCTITHCELKKILYVYMYYYRLRVKNTVGVFLHLASKNILQSYSYNLQVKKYCRCTLTHCELNKILYVYMYYYRLRVKNTVGVFLHLASKNILQSYSYTSQVKTYCSRTLTHCELNKILQVYFYTLRGKKYCWCNITHCELKNTVGVLLHTAS